mmetsp:Transcript_16900/g.25999  ORF Transcript_16900/g.25999 Transcript_16900/m.25999 type:complete len:272 (-) Transcript_16900:280-1095(-)
MLIGKTDGNRLINYIKSQHDSDKYSVQLATDFQLEVSLDNHVYAEMWYSSSDDRSLDFVKNIADYLEPLMDQIVFEPKFVTWACPKCSTSFKEKNCVSNGRYCATTNGLSDLTGREILKENLREHCLFQMEDDKSTDLTSFEQTMHKKGRAVYFEYMKRVHTECKSRINGACSKRVMQSQKIDTSYVQDCLDSSFAKKGDMETENLVLQKHASKWLALGTHLYPSLTVNDKSFRGRLTPKNVFEAFCASFVDEPKRCLNWQKMEGIKVPRG